MPVAYIWATYEDLYGEWLQVWLFVAVFMLSLFNARRDGLYRRFFIFLSVAAFYTFMEELSWGQRLINIDSPNFLDGYNLQRQISFLNFYGSVQSSVFRDIFQYTLAGALFCYGVLYPLLFRWKMGVARWLHGIGIAPPPLYLWIYFLTAASFEIGAFHFNEAEIAEILVGMALVLMLMHYLYVGEDLEGGPGMLSPARSSSCARTSGFIIALLMVLSVMTTRAIYSSPEMNARVQARVVDGYKKFAVRFEALHNFERAGEFYRRVYDARPDDEMSLRAAIRNYKAAGNQYHYQRYYRILLEKTVTPAVVANTSVENQLSLAKSYAAIGEDKLSQEYLDKALLFATERAEQFPDNSDNFYWLGRVLQQRGYYTDALEAFRRAKAMAPDIRRYAVAIRMLEDYLAEEQVVD